VRKITHRKNCKMTCSAEVVYYSLEDIANRLIFEFSFLCHCKSINQEMWKTLLCQIIISENDARNNQWVA